MHPLTDLGELHIVATRAPMRERTPFLLREGSGSGLVRVLLLVCLLRFLPAFAQFFLLSSLPHFAHFALSANLSAPNSLY